MLKSHLSKKYLLFKFWSTTSSFRRCFKTEEELKKKITDFKNEIITLEVSLYYFCQNTKKKQIEAELKKNPFYKFDLELKKKDRKLLYEKNKEKIKREKVQSFEVLEKIRKLEFEIKRLEHKYNYRSLREKRKTERYYKDKFYKKAINKENKILNDLAYFEQKDKEAEELHEIRQRYAQLKKR